MKAELLESQRALMVAFFQEMKSTQTQSTTELKGEMMAMTTELKGEVMAKLTSLLETAVQVQFS
ncbi:MAG: hypothetical protein GY696_32685 [Gammaproteobacteria bacterium]|nr:hypothetical protein [Gammaproteobacteria bacterium]